VTRTNQEGNGRGDAAYSPNRAVSRGAESRVRLSFERDQLPFGSIDEEEVSPVLSPSFRRSPQNGSLPPRHLGSCGIARQVPPRPEVDPDELRSSRGSLERNVQLRPEPEHICPRAYGVECHQVGESPRED
jgi:hypothetical protein